MKERIKPVDSQSSATDVMKEANELLHRFEELHEAHGMKFFFSEFGQLYTRIHGCQLQLERIIKEKSNETA